MFEEKIIFLDVDGVLNPMRNIRKRRTEGKNTVSYKIELDKENLKYLKRLVDETGAKIVVSSSWRIGGFNNASIDNLARQLRRLSLNIYGFTPISNARYRGDEIREYIKNSIIPIKGFVILDDDSDMGELIDHLVLCPNETGFGENEFFKAKEMLNINTLARCEEIKQDTKYSIRS